MRFDVFAFGIAAGEAALGSAFTAAAVARGHTVRGWAGQERDVNALREAGADASQVHDARFTARVAGGSDAIVCATSLTCVTLLPLLPGGVQPVVSLDSSWFPWISANPGWYSRFNRFFVAMPESAFVAGLAQNAGPYAAPRDVLARVSPVGWFAPATSNQPVGERRPNVFVYFGRDCTVEQVPCRNTLADAIEAAARSRPDIQWRFFGPPLKLPDFVERPSGWIPEEEFARWHADADLVICHHGQLTIGRAAAAGVPVLAIAEGAIFRPAFGLDFADFEIHAFARAGVVEGVHGEIPASALARRILGLLATGRSAPSGGGGAFRAVQGLEDMV